MMTKVWTVLGTSEEDFTEAQARDMSILRGVKAAAPGPLAQNWPRLELEITTQYPPADSFMFGAMLIVSQRLASVLAHIASEAIELLPVFVFHSGKKAGDFYFLHSLCHLDALDRANSQFTTEDGCIDQIDKLAVDESIAGDTPLFELEAYDWVLCVSDTLATAIESSGCRGMVLVRPENWQPC